MKKSVWQFSRKAIIGVMASSMVMVPVFGVSAASNYTSKNSISVLSQNNDQVQITESSGWLESANVEWKPVSEASGYNVYFKSKSDPDSSYKKLDSELIRQYASYFRADVLGLEKGEYVLKIVPIINGHLDSSKESVTQTLSVAQNKREGFGFSAASPMGTASGGYNDDGTLPEDAKVLYITPYNVNTVTAEVITNNKGSKTQCTGLTDILAKRQKGYDKTHLVIRMIGQVKSSQIKGLNGNGYLQLKGCYNVTFEGVGKDATAYGWGFLVRSAHNVEIRNIGIMLFPDDAVSLDTNNENIWIHNNDFFYGTAGGDADQAKGDGSCDIKKNSTYVTVSYNHFYDSGKTSLCGMGDKEKFFVTYHHNWFDHSDSRHPRIRVGSIHIYNNYFDGNSKYGVGVTMGGSAFVEANYFRNCKDPMLISRQGTDVYKNAKGTFSGEDGGMIKAYNNRVEGAERLVYANQDSSQFDAYLAKSRDEKVPASYKTAAGGNTYDNFDTSSSMYKYSVDLPENVKTIVTTYAGRVDGGDFSWKFADTDDGSYSMDKNLMSKIRGYQSGIVSFGENLIQVNKKYNNSASLNSTGVEVYVSPNGKSQNSGTYDNPVDLLTALSKVENGKASSIILKDGTYTFDKQITINASGRSDAPNVLKSMSGSNVILDFSKEPYNTSDTSKNDRGIQLNGDYWNISGIRIKDAADNGMMLSGSHNVIERCIFDGNKDSGLQISRSSSSVTDFNKFPSYNKVINCTSKNNCDPATYENADGFAAKLTCGNGNVFNGCLSYNNSDDGWDLYAKKATGSIGVVTIENCISMRNGRTEDGKTKSSCDGNGFKLGGSGVPTPHKIINCLAIENLHHGFTDNNNPSALQVVNCTAFDNNQGGGKNNFSLYRCKNAVVSNSISYTTNGTSDKFQNLTGDHIVYTNSKKWYKVTDKQSVDVKDSNERGEAISNGIQKSDFINTNIPAIGTDFDKIWRNTDGTLNTGGTCIISPKSQYGKFSSDGGVIGARF